jgi:hypothetical protein
LRQLVSSNIQTGALLPYEADISFTGIAFFFTVMTVAEGGGRRAVSHKLQDMYVPTLKANYMVWPAVQLINFRLMPIQFQLVSRTLLTYLQDITLNDPNSHLSQLSELLGLLISPLQTLPKMQTKHDRCQRHQIFDYNETYLHCRLALLNFYTWGQGLGRRLLTRRSGNTQSTMFAGRVWRYKNSSRHK